MMGKSRARNEKKKPEVNETLFLFPEQCSLGVVESRLDDTVSPVRFSIVDLSIDNKDMKERRDVLQVLRRTNSVRVTQIPHLLKEPENADQNSLIISFHEENDASGDWENPLMATIVSIGPRPNLRELKSFNEYIVSLESLGLALDFGDDVSVVMLLDLLAVGSAIFDDAPALIGNYYLHPVYYGEFQPILPNALEPLIHALGHHRRSKPASIHTDSVDLCGLLPEGLA